jgi:23S rRNA pseudouridine1911/1915/1917 synthase
MLVMIKLDILFEDNHCLAVNKPAGLRSQADRSGEPSMIDVASHYLKTHYTKPGNVYVGLLHRLDLPASGVMLLAKTSKAAARLSEQFRSGTISKLYWALVAGVPAEDAGTWADVLTKDRALNRAHATSGPSHEGKEASVDFRVIERWDRHAKLELRPRTGRSHQLRVQLSSRGLPILGDLKYGARTPLKALDGGGRIALHAREITFTHPTRHEPISVLAPVQADWPESWPLWNDPECGSSKPTAGPRR